MSKKVDKSLLEEQSVVSDVFIESIATSRVDGTFYAKITVFPDPKAEAAVLALRRTHAKMVLIPVSDPETTPGKQKPRKKVSLDRDIKQAEKNL